MKSMRCPRCGNAVWYDERTTTDFIHQCRESDNSRKTSYYDNKHQFTRIPLKIDSEWIQQAPQQLRIPEKKIPTKKITDAIKEKLDVDTYFEVG